MFARVRVYPTTGVAAFGAIQTQGGVCYQLVGTFSSIVEDWTIMTGRAFHTMDNRILSNDLDLTTLMYALQHTSGILSPYNLQ